jgi:hypothetical protein
MLNSESRLSMKTTTFTGNPPYSMPPYYFHCVTTVSAVEPNQLVACRKGEDHNPDCRDLTIHSAPPKQVTQLQQRQRLQGDHSTNRDLEVLGAARPAL